MASIIPLVLYITLKSKMLSLAKNLLKSIWFLKISIWITIHHKLLRPKSHMNYKRIYNYTVDVLSMLKGMNSLFHIITKRAFMWLWWSMDISKTPSFNYTLFIHYYNHLRWFMDNNQRQLETAQFSQLRIAINHALKISSFY